MDRSTGTTREESGEAYVEQCLEFLHALHPQEAIVLTVWTAVIKRWPTQGVPSSDSPQPHLAPRTPWQTLQRMLFAESAIWELDQELGLGVHAPRYTPTPKVLLVRFVKWLVEKTMFLRRPANLAIALGSYLYAYSPQAICAMACLKGQDRPNAYRPKNRLWDGLAARWRHTGVVSPEGDLLTAVPSAVHRQLVHDALRAFRPLDTVCTPKPEAFQFWDEHLQDLECRLAPTDFAWTLKHLLLCTGAEGQPPSTRCGCAGVHQFAQEWADGQPPSTSPDPQPAQRLRVPRFAVPDDPSGGPSGDPNDALLDDDISLSDDALSRLVHQLPDARRASGQGAATEPPHRFRVYVDGLACAQFTPSERVLHPLTVPASAMHLLVDEEDPAGSRPLAFFEFPDPDEPVPQTLTVALDSGATLTLTLLPLRDAEDLTAWQATLRWTPAAAVVHDLAWYDAVLGRLTRELELAEMLGTAAGRQALRAAQLPRLVAIEQAVRRLLDQAGPPAGVLVRLGDLYDAWGQIAQAQACWDTAAALAQPRGEPAQTPAPGATGREATWDQVALTDALHQAQGQVNNPQWGERLERWRTTWAGRAQAAARLVVEAADQAAYVVTEGLETLTTPGHQWSFALASAQDSARGAGEDQDGSPGSADLEPASPQVTIRVGQPSHEGTRLIQVRVRALPAQQAPPLVLLIPVTDGGVSQVAVLAPRQASPWLVALFRDVPQGDYLLAFEPMEDTNPA